MVRGGRPLNAKRKAYILGAGISGLVTGWMLAQKKWDVVLFEKEKQVGGLAFTQRWDDFELDFGPHIYHTVDRDLENLWEQEFGDLFVKKEFWCKNVKGEKFDEFYDYPLSYEAIRGYPPLIRDKVLEELSGRDEGRKAAAKNYREYVEALVGPTLQNMFFEIYPQKIWGLTTREMTANWAPKRIELREKKTPFYTGRWNAVGKYGSGCIVGRMAEKIRQLGGRIRLNTEVQEIEGSETLIEKIRLANGEEINVSPEDVVISSIPITVLAKLFHIENQLSFRGVIAVALAFKKPVILPEGVHFLYYDSPEIIFHRISEQKKFSDSGFPADKTFVTAEITYAAGDELDQAKDQALVDRVLGDLVRVGLAEKEDFEQGIVMKRPCVYPLLKRDYEHQLRHLQARFAKRKSLYVVGGPAEYNYADIHINFLKAMDLAKVLDEKHAEFYQEKKSQIRVRPCQAVELNGKRVGLGAKPFIIAEAGLNHNGKIEMAIQLIEEAKKAHCDAVKFQSFSAENRVSNKVKKARYAEQIIGMEENIYELLSKLELSADDHRKLFAYGKKIGIDIFSTPFDFASVELLESLNAPYYKIASSDLTHLPLLARIARTGKPVILSTGMATLGEIEEAVSTILREGNPKVVLLHCLSSYPADPTEANLRVIQTLKQNFQVPVGFSDHAVGLSVSIAALALGADLIERHFTLDRRFEGPDHIFSSEPPEMSELTRLAVAMNGMVGDGVKTIQPSEYETINMFKKTIYAATKIPAGAEIREEMLAVKGPAGGLSPRYWPVVIGRMAKRNIEADHPITWDDI